MSTWSTVKATMWPLVVFILELSGVTCELDYERENDWIWIDIWICRNVVSTSCIILARYCHDSQRCHKTREDNLEQKTRCGMWKLLGSWVLNIEYGDYLME